MSRTIVNVEEFLQDEEFVKWVKAPTRESNQYWQSWAEAYPENRANMHKARELILSMHFHLPKPTEQERNTVLEQILRSSHQATQTIPQDENRKWVPNALKIAASLLLLVTLVYLFQIFTQQHPEPAPESLAETMVIKETTRGTKMQTKLPDGTLVWLNAESKLSYQQSYGVNNRTVELTGEAFFEVTEDKQKPFIVQSGELRTRALGTAFNVRAFPQDKSIDIALVTGKVAVQKSDQQTDPLILLPGKKISHRSDSEKFVETDFNYEQEIGWKDELLCFKGAGFQEVKQKLERWFGVTLHSENLTVADWDYTAMFDNQSLELVLQRMSFTKNFDFRINGKDIYLYNKK